MNDDLARALAPELERAGWTLSLGSIVAVLDAFDIHRRAKDDGELPEDRFAREAARYEKNLNAIHRLNEELEREICCLIRENARLLRDSLK